MMKGKFLCIFFLLIATQFIAKAQSTLSIAGDWQIRLDRNKVGEKENWPKVKFSDIIKLPGTTDEAGYGNKNEGTDTGYLTRPYKYTGAAWYSREITIPANWKGKEIFLLLERVLWESKVYLNGKLLEKKDALSVPHLHQLGALKPGKHWLSVRVDNSLIYNIGDKGHMYTDHTQTIWNGIVGKIELIAREKDHITSIKTFPDAENKKLGVVLKFSGTDGVKNASITYQLKNLQNDQVVFRKTETAVLRSNEYTTTLSIDQQVFSWDEFNPVRYRLEVILSNGRSTDNATTDFGFRKVSRNASKILLNNQPVFIRGNLDCLNFPLTGYPSCEVSYWKEIFEVYRQHGLNYVHFHSGCPPEAAFIAADEMGLYIGVEVVWIDWWMTSTPADRPDMITLGKPNGLGKNPSADEFVQAELNRIVESYGNHPSFLTLSIGNELGNSDFDVMQSWIQQIKDKDNRRLYSVSSARKKMPVDDYYDTHNLSGVGSTIALKAPGTNWDFEAVYKRSDVPILAHEVGQIPVYPRWSEIDKYTGVLKARNLASFKLVAEKNGIADQDEHFSAASGSLQRINYKAIIESFYRTPSCGGFNLLSMQDYPGQGEALVGWLDPFYASKGITDAATFYQYSNTTVPLLRMDKVTWKNTETLTAKAQLAYYGEGTLNAAPYYNILNDAGQVLQEGDFHPANIQRGTVNDLGNIEFKLSSIAIAQKIKIVVGLKGTTHKNEWDAWVYPEITFTTLPDHVYIANAYDENCKNALRQGKNVLLFAGNLGNDTTKVVNTFHPVFWSYTFFPGQGSTTLGILIKDKHPAFKEFPTENFTNWQWEAICRKKVSEFYLNDLPKTYQPIAQPIDDFHRNNKLGALFEMKVDNGKLLVCGFDLSDTENIVAKQLKHSLLSYISSSAFDPGLQVPDEKLEAMFPKNMIAENKAPEGFENSILYVECGFNQQALHTNEPWSKAKDKISVQDKTDYKVAAEGVWKDTMGYAWFGKEMKLEVACPQGVTGAVYVHFADWDAQGREGLLNFEGRAYQLVSSTKEGQWVKLFMMREDTNDGKLILSTKVTRGSNLMIDKIAVVVEK